MHHHRRTSSHGGSGLATGLLALAAGTVAFMAARHFMSERQHHPMDDASQRAARRNEGWREHRVVGRTVTISKPRQQLYDHWRKFSNLAAFMENVDGVEVLDDKRSRWTIRAPGESDISFVSRITEDRPGELIAWESEEDAEVRNSGRVVFRDAPAGRGTEVELTIAYDPPGGRIGELVAKLFQREPNIQARRDLKRFKQLIETGEIAVSSPYRDDQTH